MRRTLQLITILLLGASTGFPAAGPRSDANSLHFKILPSASDQIAIRSDFSALSFARSDIDGRSFTTVELPGEPSTCIPGNPVLPVVSRFVIVPPESNIKLVVSSSDPRRVGAQNPQLFIEEPGDQVEYNGGLFPAQYIQMSYPLIVRGVRMVQLTIYPVQYDSRTNEYIVRDNIEATIASVGGVAINPVTHPNRPGLSRSFEKFIKAIAVNGESIGRDDPVRDDPAIPESHYLVVTHEQCLPYIIDFIEWKRKSGNRVDIMSVPQNEVEDPQAIKQAIQNRYDEFLDAGVEPFDQILLVGDRSMYNSDPRAQWILSAFEGNSNWPQANHADYMYACLEGNDDYPDVGFSRWIAGSEATLELAVARTLSYEAEPFMDAPEWYSRAAVYSQHWGNAEVSEWHPSVPMGPRWAEELLRTKGFDDIPYYEEFQWDSQGNQIGPWLRDQINVGTNLMVGRAQNWYWRNELTGVEDNTIFPINITSANHSDIVGPTMFRNGDANHLKGFVALTFTWGELGTTGSIVPCNVLWMEMVKGVLAEDLPLGWARLFALANTERIVPDILDRGEHIHPMFRTDFDVIGDPGLQPWIGVPRMVEAQLNTEASPERNFFDVTVTDQDGNPVPDATVIFYAPGNIPDNPEEYADYEDYLIRRTTSDTEGHAVFLFDTDMEFVDGSPLYLTVTGRDIRPFFLENQFGAPETGLELVSYSLEEVEGNGDDDVNPGESFAMSLTVRNIGENSLADVTANLGSFSHWITVDPDIVVDFGDIDTGAEAVCDRILRFQIDRSCPDASLNPDLNLAVQINFEYENGSEIEALNLDPKAQGYSIVELAEGGVLPDGLVDFDLTLRNVGRMDGEQLLCELVSMSTSVAVPASMARFPAIEEGGSSNIDGDPFIVAGNRIAIPGAPQILSLRIESESGWKDTLEITIQIGRPHEEAPQVPDKYGYICFDDTDQDWEMAPGYDWVEIDPNAQEPDVEGTRLDFEGESEYDIGEAVVVDLGFETQFYGQRYDHITVTSNGFIAVGSQPRIVSFQNMPLDHGIGGGSGMIAPFWTDLRFGDNSGIYFYYDENEARAIIEWSGMRYAGQNLDNELTFQVILYDHGVWITESGDQNILFQYKNVAVVRNVRRGYTEWRTAVPFPSVGISSPEGTSGINYCSNNEYPISSAQLEDRRAILFGTSAHYRSCVIYGTITDAETGAPIFGAMVYTEHGFVVITDEDRNFWIRGALAEIPFVLYVRADGYNEMEVEVDPVPEGD